MPNSETDDRTASQGISIPRPDQILDHISQLSKDLRAAKRLLRISRDLYTKKVPAFSGNGAYETR
jgi:hypothetical protein